jgi:hypothetical protein
VSPGTQVLAPPFTATPRQDDVAQQTNDLAARIVTAGGAIRSGKTQSAHAAEIEQRRRRWYREGQSPVCWADPSVFAHHGHSNRWGQPKSIATEYAEHGVYLRAANNDRPAGYARLLELLHVEPGRIAPRWAQLPEGVGGAPRLYVFRTCRHTIEQLKSAPVAADGVVAGEAVDPKWESAHGHAHAALRYGAMSRPSPSTPPPEELDDPRTALLRRNLERWESGEAQEGRYVQV